MNQETKNQIHYIATHVNDLDIMKSYIQLKQINDLYRCRCPFHNERTPSFTVYPKGFINSKKEEQDHLTYYCFGCSAAGNIVNFVHRIENHDTYDETFEFFEKKYGVAFGEDERLMDIKQQLQFLQNNSSVNIMSINELNIRCSSYCRRYLFEVREDYPHLFDREFDYLQELYKWLDDNFENKSAIQLQNIYEEVVKKINNRKILLEK